MYSSQEWWSSGISSQSGGGGGDPGDPIAASLRFRGETTNNLRRAMPSATSDNWCLSFWHRSACAYTESPNSIRPHMAYIANGDSGSMECIDDDWYSSAAATDNGFGYRSWYHGSGWVSNSTDNTTNNRDAGSWEHWFIKQRTDIPAYSELYINGVLYCVTASYTSAKNATFVFGGVASDDTRYHYKGNLADIRFVEGDAGLEAQVTDFGRVNDIGHWVPKEYEGPYGDNGFWLQFDDPNNVGADNSGNSNDFTLTGDIKTDVNDFDYDLSFDSPTNTFAQVNGAYSGRSNWACKGGKGIRGQNASSSNQGVPLTISTIASDLTTYFELDATYASSNGGAWGYWSGGFFLVSDPKLIPIEGISSEALYNASIEIVTVDYQGDTINNNLNSQQDVRITNGETFTGNKIMGVLIDQGNLTITCDGNATTVTDLPLNINPDDQGNYHLYFYAYYGSNDPNAWNRINTGWRPFRHAPTGVNFKRLCSEDLYGLETCPVSQEHFQAYQAGPDRVIDESAQLGGNWSFYTTTNTSFSSSQPREFGFNGNLGNAFDAAGVAGVYTEVIWAPEPPIDITGKTVRVRAANDDSNIMIGPITDPDTVTVTSQNNSYVTVPPGIRTEIGPASPLIIRRNQTSGSTGWSAVEIDGQVVVDAGVPVIAQQKMPYGLYWSKDMSVSSDWQMWDYQNGAAQTQPFSTGGIPGQVMRAYVADNNPSVVYAWNAGETGINTEAGFSISTGTHGLDKKPELVISSNGYIWVQKFDDVDGNPTTYFTHLNDAYGYNQGRVLNGEWNVTSSNISCSDPQVDDKFYAWHSVEGFSKFGYWNTNPSGSSIDGVYIKCGFQPAVVWVWYTGETSGDFHYIYSNNIKQYNSNASQQILFGAGNGPVVNTYALLDFTGDGFKFRGGGTYPNMNNMSWAAWAEMPATSSLATRFYNI